MRVYTPEQWLLLFYFYCLCGWIWESCFVSCKQRHWVNRGFLHGPWLPIYGSGAIIILFATLPVRGSAIGIALMGTFAATLLEYVTGAVMERIFKMRYWDYTNQPFNLNGYICLTSSIGWAGFSWLLVRVIHPPIDRLLQDVPFYLTGPLAGALTVLFVWDVVTSVRQALDLKELLTKLTEENEELRRLAKRAEVVSALADDDLRKFREAIKKLERARKTVQSRESRRYRQAARILRGNPSARAPRHGEALRSLRDVAGIRGKEKDD